MTIIKVPKSPFWYAHFTINGKTIHRSTKTKNLVIARQLELKWRNELILEPAIAFKPSITLSEAIELLRNDYKSSKKKVSFETFRKRFLGLLLKKANKVVTVTGLNGDKHIHDLTDAEITRLLFARRDEGLSPSSIKKEITFLSKIIERAEQIGHRVPKLNFKQFRNLPMCKEVKKPIRFLTGDEEQRLMDAIDPSRPENRKRLVTPQQLQRRQDLYDFVICLFDTCARHTEISHLKWSQVDLDAKVIRLIRGKVGNESQLVMTNRVYDVLKRRSESKDNEYVFTSTVGGPRRYTPNSFKAAMKRAGIEGGAFHLMRKTTASKLVRAGLAISDVSAVLGHSTVGTTQAFYGSLSPLASSKRTVEMLDSMRESE